MSAFVPNFILEQSAADRHFGTLACASLFADISGFTALTEALSEHGREGAETLALALRFYFDPLVDAVHEAGGFITGFAGDAFTALFPESGARPVADYALWAASRMQSFFTQSTRYESPFGQFEFALKVGLSWGHTHWAAVEVASNRSVHYFQGPAVDGCAAAEHRAQRGEIIYDQGLAERLTTPNPPPRLGGVYQLNTQLEALAPVPYNPPTTVDAGRFLPPGVAAMPPEGEFRNIASAFVSFDGIEELTKLIWLVYRLSEQQGGTFAGVDFGDKGGNVLVHFGAPTAHENDAERAMEFALSLLEIAPEGCRLRAGVTYDLRYAGFNGGRQRREFACLGRGTNLAARLMMKAPWGKVWCGPGMVRRVRRRYQWESLGEHTFKGFAHPLPVMVPTGRRLVPSSEKGQAARMVGRDAELQSLLDWSEPLAQGQFVGVLYVGGEAGMGKTLLAEAFREELLSRHGAGAIRWLGAPTDQLFAHSFEPLCSALFTYFEQSHEVGAGGENKERFRELLLALVQSVDAENERLAAELIRLESVLGALLGLAFAGSLYEQLEPELRYENTLMALRMWLQAESCRQPLLLHLEDGHWLDVDTIEALQRLCRLSTHYPIGVLMTSRPREDGSEVRLELARIVPQAQVRLSELGAVPVRAVMENRLQSRVSDKLAEFVAKKSGGNPFFAEQLVLHLVEQDLLTRTEGGYGPPREGEVLPQDVNALLIARLDRLTTEVKRVAQAASVLGQEFLVRTLSLMLREADATYPRVLAAAEKGVWSEVAELRYLFRHALMRDAAYQMQARSRLRQLHLAAAKAIEELHVEDRGEYQAVLGYHWEHGGEIDKAGKYYLCGARKARDAYAHEEVERLFLAYLRLVIEPRLGNVAVRNELGVWYESTGRMEKAEAQHRLALREVREIGDREREGKSLYYLGIVLYRTGRLEEANALYDEALAIQREVGDRGGEGGTLRNLGLMRMEQGRMEEARAFYEQSLAIQREVGDRCGEGSTLANLAILHFEQGYVKEARAFYEHALTIAREVDHRRDEARVLGNLAILHNKQGRVEEASSLYENALAIQREVGDQQGEGATLGNLAVLHFGQGRVREAGALFKGAVAIAREVGDRRFEGIWLFESSRLALVADRGVDQAEQLNTESQTLFREVGDLFGLSIVLCGSGHISLARGESAEAIIGEATGVVNRLGAAPGSHPAEELAKLLRAQSAWEAGEQNQLFRGQLIEDYTERQRCWLIEHGHLLGGE